MSLDYTERWNTTEQTLPSNKRPLGGCRVEGCTWVLAHFYCRKPNWSARVCAPSFLSSRWCIVASVSLSLSLLHKRVYFANPPGCPTILGSRRVYMPCSEYKSRCFLSRALPQTAKTVRSLSLMKMPVAQHRGRLLPSPSD